MVPKSWPTRATLCTSAPNARSSPSDSTPGYKEMILLRLRVKLKVVVHSISFLRITVAETSNSMPLFCTLPALITLLLIPLSDGAPNGITSFTVFFLYTAASTLKRLSKKRRSAPSSYSVAFNGFQIQVTQVIALETITWYISVQAGESAG